MEQTEIAREQGAPAASILAEQAWEGKVRKVFSWIVSVYLCVVFGACPLYFQGFMFSLFIYLVNAANIKDSKTRVLDEFDFFYFV